MAVVPVARVAQNADGEASRRLRALCEALMEWHTEWRQALGLDMATGRRGKPPTEKIRPDQVRLTTARDTALSMLETTEREVEVARRRRLEADSRIEAARRRI